MPKPTDCAQWVGFMHSDACGCMHLLTCLTLMGLLCVLAVHVLHGLGVKDTASLCVRSSFGECLAATVHTQRYAGHESVTSR